MNAKIYSHGINEGKDTHTHGMDELRNYKIDTKNEEEVEKNVLN